MVAAPHGGIRIMAEPPTPDAPVRTTAVFRPDPRHQYHPDETTLQARALFRELPIFRDVPAHHVRELARMAGSHVFAPGEVIVRMGDFGSTMYVINSGKVEVVLERPTGNVVLATLGPGEFFGELSIFDSELRSATVIAVEKTETVSLGRIDVVRALTHSPDLALSLLKSLSVRLRQANTRLGEQAEQSPAP